MGASRASKVGGVHDVLKLPVGIVWCFKVHCEVPSVGSLSNGLTLPVTML